MEAIINIYFLDTNVISKLSKAERSSSFFATNVKIPECVIDELGNPKDLEALKRLSYPVNANVLCKLKLVMLEALPGDYRLVDLYNNKGAADPFIIASILDFNECNSEQLFRFIGVLVSNDKAVNSLANYYGIESIEAIEFRKLVQANM